MTSAPPRPSSHLVRRCLLALAGAMAFAPTWGHAQSLRELYDAARAYDATFLAARALADSSQYRLAQAEALNRPNVGLLANAARTDVNVPSTVTGTNRVPIPGTDGHFYNNRVDAAVSASQPLYNRSNDATIAQAQRAYEAAQADLESAEQDLIIRVAQAYFDVLAAYDALVTSQTGKAAIAEQLASAKRNFEVGTATITDTREAQARFDLSTAAEIAAENDLRTKRVALDQLVGRTNVVPKPLAEPVTLPGPMPDDIDAWVDSADRVHPQIRKARLGLEIARLETERARAAEGVTVDLIGSVGANRTVGTATTSPGNTANSLIGLQLKLPLYTGGATQNRIKETLSLEEKSRNDLEAARRGVAQGTRTAFLGLKSGRAQVSALEAAESSSKLALEATQLGYKVGVRVNIDVLNAQTQLNLTQRDLARARYDVVVNGLRLRQAAGELQPADVDAVNALLAP